MFGIEFVQGRNAEEMRTYQVRLAVLAASLLLCLATSQVKASDEAGQQIGVVTSVANANSDTDTYIRESEMQLRQYESDPDTQLQTVRNEGGSRDDISLVEAARDDARNYAHEARQAAKSSLSSAYEAKVAAHQVAETARAIKRNVLKRGSLKIQRTSRGYRWIDRTAGKSGYIPQGRLDKRLKSLKNWVSQNFATKADFDALAKEVRGKGGLADRVGSLESAMAELATKPSAAEPAPTAPVTPVAPEATAQPEPPAPAEIASPPTTTAPVAPPTNRGGINWTKVGWWSSVIAAALLLIWWTIRRLKSSDRRQQPTGPLTVASAPNTDYGQSQAVPALNDENVASDDDIIAAVQGSIR